MSNALPEVPLAEIAKPISRNVEVIPGQSYRTIGVKWWGEGAYERQTIDGSRTAAKTLSLVRQGDLIINKIWVRHGSTAIAGADVDGCAASGEFPTFTLDENRVTPRWLHWQTKTRGFWAKCDALSQGTSGKNRIKPELFLTIRVPLPPLVEQRRVVARIEALATQIQEARTLRHQAAEEAAILIPSGMAGIFKKLAEKYLTKKLEDLCDVVRGGSPRPAGSPLYYGGDIPFMKVGDLTKDDGMYLYEASASVNELGREQSRFIEADTLMLTNSGATLGVPKITKIAGCFNDGSQAFLNLDSSVEKEFLYYLFKSKTLWFREQLARGQGQPNLNTDMTKQMDAPVPPLPEQRRIVAELDALQAEVNALKRLQAETAAELDALLPAILDRAFKGEL